jgi:hypothetical protein
VWRGAGGGGVFRVKQKLLLEGLVIYSAKTREY